MEKVWLKSYPKGVRPEIDVRSYETVSQMLEEAMKKFAARPAYVCMGTTLNYGEVDALSRKLATFFQMRGVSPGGRIAIMMPNVLQYPVTVAAILRAGFVVVNINPLYTPRELEYQLNDSGAEAVVILENFAITLERVIANAKALKTVVVATVGDLLGAVKGAITNFVVRNVKKAVPVWSIANCVNFNDAIKQGASGELKASTRTYDDPAFLQYTGGTTGVSKGAILLNSNIIANVLQAQEWMQPALNTRDDKGPQYNFVCCLPLYHIFALTVINLVGTKVGALSLLIPNPRDLPGVIKELSSFKFNIFPGLNTLFNGLANNPEFAKLNFSTLKLTIGGGMATQRAVAERWRQVTGSSVVEGYGLSETSPLATCNTADVNGFTGTIGLPIPNTDISIRDEYGIELPFGESGEICIRGPQVMAGYWKRPDETAKVITKDGYFTTGDIGIMDDNGYIRIVDRKKDMVLVSGFNVFPTEIEEVSVMHPGVLEAACIGIPDKTSGEAVKVFIVRKDPALTEADLKAFYAAKLTGYKRPKVIEFRDDLPKSPVGKILRRELREK